MVAVPPTTLRSVVGELLEVQAGGRVVRPDGLWLREIEAHPNVVRIHVVRLFEDVLAHRVHELGEDLRIQDRDRAVWIYLDRALGRSLGRLLIRQ